MIKDLLMIPKKKKSPTDVVQETSDENVSPTVIESVPKNKSNQLEQWEYPSNIRRNPDVYLTEKMAKNIRAAKQYEVMFGGVRKGSGATPVVLKSTTEEDDFVASLDYVKRHDPSLFYHMQNWSEHARRLRVKQRMTQFRNDGHLE